MPMPNWLEFVQAHAGLIVSLSVLTLVATLALAVYFITRIPADYFCHQHRRVIEPGAQHPLLRAFLLGLKNLVGVFLFLAGLIMLVTPGQGLASMFVGIMLTDFPRKYELESWLVRRRHVLPAINWLRRRFNHPPLTRYEDCHEGVPARGRG